MNTRKIKNPETAYNGDLIDSLMATVKKIDPNPQTPTPTQAERNGRDGRAA